MQKGTSTQKVDVKLGCQDKGKGGFRTIFLQFESASRRFQPGKVSTIIEAFNLIVKTDGSSAAQKITCPISEILWICGSRVIQNSSYSLHIQ